MALSFKELAEKIDRVERSDYKLDKAGRKTHKEITFKDGEDDGDNMRESYNDNRTGFSKRKREDDEYHTPDPVTRTHKIIHTVSKDGGEKHSRTVTISNSTKSHEEAKATARAHLEKQGYKIHEEIELEEAAKGHTIEAHGIKGMKGTPWRKTFKSHDQLNDWAEKNDSVEVHGTRELEGVKKQVKESSDVCKVCGQTPCNCTSVEEGLKPEHNMRPGWMLKADPELAAKVKKNKEIAKARKASYGNPDAGKSVKEEVEAIDEISSKLAGNYYGAATKKHLAKVGMKANMYDRIEKDMGKKRKTGVDRALDRITGQRKTNEEVGLDEATPYYQKASWIKKMSAAAKQECLAREKKEKENQSKQVKEDSMLGFKAIMEKLNLAKASMGDVVKDFQQSDAPQFAGKSKEKRQQMAVAAKLAADRGVKEEVEVTIDEAFINGREYASHGLMHPDHAKMAIHQKTGHDVDFYASKTGDKMQGRVVKNDGKSVHIQAHNDKELGDGKLHKFKVTPHLPKSQNEETDAPLTYSSFVAQLNEYENDKNGRYVHTKGSYGKSYQGDDDEDEKPKQPAVKRGRGRPAGSGSGARQQGSGSGKSYGGIATHSLNLPNSK